MRDRRAKLRSLLQALSFYLLVFQLFVYLDFLSSSHPETTSVGSLFRPSWAFTKARQVSWEVFLAYQLHRRFWALMVCLL